MELFLVFTVLPAIVGYHAAQGRHRTAWKGAACGFLFGWLGVIVLLVVLKTRDPETGNLR